MLPETFQSAINNAFLCVTHVCKPNKTIFSTFFTYGEERPNVKEHMENWNRASTAPPAIMQNGLSEVWWRLPDVLEITKTFTRVISHF